VHPQICGLTPYRIIRVVDLEDATPKRNNKKADQGSVKAQALTQTDFSKRQTKCLQ
jgi:hypothetical protein